MEYIERDGAEKYFTMTNFPESLTKKVTLLKYFRNYMSEHLLKAGANITPRDSDDYCRLPFLKTWFRTRSAINLHLSNGTVQVSRVCFIFFSGRQFHVIFCQVHCYMIVYFFLNLTVLWLMN